MRLRPLSTFSKPHMKFIPTSRTSRTSRQYSFILNKKAHNILMNLRIKINVAFTALFFLLLSFSNVQAQVQKAHYNTYISTYSNGFYDYLPQGYDPNGTTLYPVIIFV